MFEFPCPHCSTTLRLRDKTLRNREIDCPACKMSVLIRDDGKGLVGSVPKENVLPYPETKITPLMIGSVVVALAVLGWIIMQANSSALPPQKNEEVVFEPTEVPSQVNPDEEDEVVADVPVSESVEPVAARLNSINALIAKHLKKHGEFPIGVVASEQPLGNRFSWIAKLDSEFGSAAGLVDWEKSWQAPVQDRFVRRRIEMFQNPTLKRFVGEDNLPATHFVGITGYGDNAATLPVTHPRAGIFGVDRRTKEADVTDGLANTMLVAGVSEQLGSWARAGNSTMRSFTAQPYINGPDGFDTGNPDGMYVLMADGSVKFLNKETETVIIERMAAMGDSLPLDANVVKTEPQMVEEPKTPQPDEMPILVPLAPDKPPFDINEHLQNKVLAYQQPKPTPVGIVLQEIEELISVRIDRTQLSEEQLAFPITVEQTDATFLDLLIAVTDAAELRYELETQSIKIQPLERLLR